MEATGAVAFNGRCEEADTRSAGFPVAFSGRLGTVEVRLRLCVIPPCGVMVRPSTEERRDCHGSNIAECISGPRLKASASQLADHSMLREHAMRLFRRVWSVAGGGAHQRGQLCLRLVYVGCFHRTVPRIYKTRFNSRHRREYARRGENQRTRDRAPNRRLGRLSCLRPARPGWDAARPRLTASEDGRTGLK